MKWEMIRSHLLRISARVRKTHRVELDPASESLLNLRLYSRAPGWTRGPFSRVDAAHGRADRRSREQYRYRRPPPPGYGGASPGYLTAGEFRSLSAGKGVNAPGGHRQRLGGGGVGGHTIDAAYSNAAGTGRTSSRKLFLE